MQWFQLNIVGVSEIEKVYSKIFYLYLKAIRVFVRETANGRFPKPIKMKIKQIAIGENLWREKGCPSAKKICARLYTKTIIMYNDIKK